MVAHAAGLGQQFLQGRDLGPELVQPDGGRELIGQLVALGVVEVVLFLLDVGEAALQLGQPPRPLGRRQVFKLLQQILLLSKPAADRLVDGHRRAGEAPLEHGPGQGHAGLPAGRWPAAGTG